MRRRQPRPPADRRRARLGVDARLIPLLFILMPKEYEAAGQGTPLPAWIRESAPGQPLGSQFYALQVFSSPFRERTTLLSRVGRRARLIASSIQVPARRLEGGQPCNLAERAWHPGGLLRRSALTLIVRLWPAARRLDAFFPRLVQGAKYIRGWTQVRRPKAASTTSAVA